MLTSHSRFWSCAAVLLALSMLAPFTAHGAGETVVEMKALSGLRYDKPRFQVAPGAKVKIVLSNTDEMAHNLIITAPGARMAVVNAAMALPVTPEQDFVPKIPQVLWAVPVLAPGKTAALEFTAPAKEGVYPYVCSYPGHGFVMYGAMYVTEKKLPSLAKDPNVPPGVQESDTPLQLHAEKPQRPYLYRIFLRDSGPASIAVALPGEQNYCWDAGACRLRYAWRGDFVDPRPHWTGNGNGYAEVLGRIYWRAGAEFPLRLGAAGPGSQPPAVKFHGYRLVDGFPEFSYTVGGVEIHEQIKPLHHGGLQQTFSIPQVKTPVTYLGRVGNGAVFTSDAGAFSSGALQLAPEQARKFSVTITETPGEAPLRYWSMDDTMNVKVKGRGALVEGVKGRALVFDGKAAQEPTGLQSTALREGATFMIWAQVGSAEKKDQVFLGAKDGGSEFALAFNHGGSGFSAHCGAIRLAAPPVAEKGWHQLAATWSKAALSFYLDGKLIAESPAAALPEDAEFFLGSMGGTDFASAELDEAAIYERILSGGEIAALYQQVHSPSRVQP